MRLVYVNKYDGIQWTVVVFFFPPRSPLCQIAGTLQMCKNRNCIRGWHYLSGLKSAFSLYCKLLRQHFEVSANVLWRNCSLNNLLPVFSLKYSTELPYSGPNQMDEMWGSLQLYCWPLARVFVAMGTTAKKLYWGEMGERGGETGRTLKKLSSCYRTRDILYLMALNLLVIDDSFK